MKKSMIVFLCLFVVFLTACSDYDDVRRTSRKSDRESSGKTTIETREELVEILKGVVETDFDTLWDYHSLLREPYYICGYMNQRRYSGNTFELGDEETYSYHEIEVTNVSDYSKSTYKDNDFIYIEAYPHGEDKVYYYEMSKSKLTDEHISVEEYRDIYDKVYSTYFELDGFIGDIEEKYDSYWLCKMYESKEAYSNSGLYITLHFDEYPENINGTEIRVVGEYGESNEEPKLYYCSVVDD